MKTTKTPKTNISRLIFFTITLTYNIILGFYLRDFLVLSPTLQVFYLLSALPTLFLIVEIKTKAMRATVYISLILIACINIAYVIYCRRVFPFLALISLVIVFMYFICFTDNKGKDNLLTKIYVLVVSTAIVALLFSAYISIYEQDDVSLTNGQATLWDTNTLKLADEICGDCNTDEEKVKAIYKWMIHNFEYDYEYNPVVQYFNVHKTLQTQKGVCYDFSHLFAALCRSQNIPCYVVDGDKRDNAQYHHAWNRVYFDGSWWNMDLTFDIVQTKKQGELYGFHKIEDAFVTLEEYLITRIYSLTAGENTHIGNSPSSNWVVVPIYQSDVGREVTVTVTPVYKSVQDKEIVFKIGSRYAVFMQRLTIDLPQMLLSALCIIMGILIIIVHLCFIANKRTSSSDMIYLGIFSLLVGIWRITDTRFSPIMFNNTAALGYITLSALFIMPVPMLLFIDKRHTGKFRFLLPSVALANCALAIAALLSQVAGIAELRETLTACHIMLIVDIAALVFFSVANAHKGAKERNTNIFVALLILGSITDFVYFYINDTSSGLIFTTVAFLIYTFYLFTENILNIKKKANLDANTKLFNKSHWDEFIEENIPADEPIGIMMLDLNRLKQTNDTLGHKIGDMMIVNFARILRTTFGSDEFLCRWGGDEFTVLVRNADRDKMENYDSAIHTAVEAYNRSGEKPEIYFACGYALSTDFPGLSRKELFAKADERMYSDKQQWYDNIARSV